jgi:hypothetical protein
MRNFIIRTLRKTGLILALIISRRSRWMRYGVRRHILAVPGSNLGLHKGQLVFWWLSWGRCRDSQKWITTRPRLFTFFFSINYSLSNQSKLLLMTMMTTNFQVASYFTSSYCNWARVKMSLIHSCSLLTWLRKCN